METILTDKFKAQVVADLRRHEGFREYAYPDPLSFLAKRYPNERWGFVPAKQILDKIKEPASKGLPWTVGYGFTGPRITEDSFVSKVDAVARLEEKIQTYADMVTNVIPNWQTYSFTTQTVLINMCFNMGPKGLASFKNTLAAIDAREFTKAARNMEQSRWYRQVGARAVELVKRIETQQIEPAHRI